MRSGGCGGRYARLVLVVTVSALPALRVARAAPAGRATVAVPAVTKVTVVDPPADDRILVEAGVRIRAELDAAGLSNRAIACAGGVGSAACDATASAAAIALSRQDGLATIRVIATLPDGYELHRLIRVPGAAGGDDPSVLAVRAVELLRDIYLDIPRDFPHREAAPSEPARPAAVASAPAAPAGADRKPLRVFLGAAVLTGRRGLGPAVAPVLSLALPVGYGLSLAATASGPFEKLIGDVEPGTASTTQALAMVGVHYELVLGRFGPFASLATGVHYLRAEGTPTQMMNQLMAADAISPLLAFGAGVSVWVRRWLAATAQLESFYTQPVNYVTVGGVIVGQSGGPSLLAQLGLSVSLGER
ncbi:MAG TPA: hypothetical protein VIF57_22715 [Polyangia bacterium]|jgi:hypothetical protein